MEEYVNIDGQRFKLDLVKASKGMSITKISTMILNRNESYITNCATRGKMNTTDYKKLCDLFNLDRLAYIVDEEEIKKELPQNENIITGITSIVNTLKLILAENKEIKYKLKNIEEMTKAMKDDAHKTNEKVNAIFTEVKYNK